MGAPVVRQSKAGNVLVKMMHFWAAGDAEPEITHKYDYTLLVAKGKARIVTDGVDDIFTAPHIVYVKANIGYKVTAATDNLVVYGIYALRDTEGVLLEPDMVPDTVPELKQVIANLHVVKSS